jgi:hypothetical protein
MCRTTDSTEEDIQDFEVVMHCVGLLWHQRGLSVTPKLHVMESHVAEQLRYYGNLGKLCEETIEREHAVFNGVVRHFHNFRDWGRKMAAIHERRRAQSDARIQEVIAQCEQTRKRKLGPAAEQRQQQREEEKRAALAAKRARYVALAYHVRANDDDLAVIEHWQFHGEAV